MSIITVDNKIPIVDGKAIESKGTEITDGLAFYNRMNDALNRPTEVKVFGTIVHPSMLASTTGNGYMFYRVSKITFADAITAIKNDAFYSCGLEVSFVDFAIPQTVMSIEKNAFRSSGIVNAEFPLAVSVLNSWVFCDAKWLETVKMPGITSMPGTSTSNSAITGVLTKLRYVEAGSVGKTVTSCAPYAINCNNQGLEIVVYSNGTYADAIVTNLRTHATNATILIKASENTTYGGNSYLAGETMITSTPT